VVIHIWLFTGEVENQAAKKGEKAGGEPSTTEGKKNQDKYDEVHEGKRDRTLKKQKAWGGGFLDEERRSV